MRSSPLDLKKDGPPPTLAPFLAEGMPAVVNISVQSRQPTLTNALFDDPFFLRFFDMQPKPRQQMNP